MDYNIQKDETEIDMRKLKFTIINRWHFIILLGIIGAVLIGLINITTLKHSRKSLFESDAIPYYESTTTMEVIFMDEKSQQSEAALELTRSQTVLKQVSKKMELDTTIEELMELVKVSIEGEDTLYHIRIRALNEKPDIAREMADGIREGAIRFITNSMNIKSYKVIEQANLPDQPTVIKEIEDDENAVKEQVAKAEASNFKKFFTRVIIGGILGILLGLFIIFIQFSLNDNIQTPDDVERYLGKRVLASIPLMEDPKNNKENAVSGRGVGCNG